jgi:hypothetical protein
MAPKGWSGGMILGINPLTFDIGQIEGDFFIRFKLRHKEDDFKFNAVIDNIRRMISTLFAAWADPGLGPLGPWP